MNVIDVQGLSSTLNNCVIQISIFFLIVLYGANIEKEGIDVDNQLSREQVFGMTWDLATGIPGYGYTWPFPSGR